MSTFGDDVRVRLYGTNTVFTTLGALDSGYSSFGSNLIHFGDLDSTNSAGCQTMIAPDFIPFNCLSHRWAKRHASRWRSEVKSGIRYFSGWENMMNIVNDNRVSAYDAQTKTYSKITMNNAENILPEYGISYYVIDGQRPARYDEIRRIINSRRFLVMGKKLSTRSGGLGLLKQVLQKIQDICKKYSIKMSHLMATIDYLSDFNLKYKNPKSGSVGLIAFKPETDPSSDLKIFKITTDQILQMNMLDQLELIDKYLSRRSSQFSEDPNLAEVFTAIALGVVIPSKDKTPPWDLNSTIFSSINKDDFIFGSVKFGALDNAEYPGKTRNLINDGNLQLGEILADVIQLSIEWETTADSAIKQAITKNYIKPYEQSIVFTEP
jgi:hypothetical protein